LGGAWCRFLQIKTFDQPLYSKFFCDEFASPKWRAQEGTAPFNPATCPRDGIRCQQSRGFSNEFVRQDAKSSQAVVPRREHGFAVDGFCSPAFRMIIDTIPARRSERQS
jgi:hypothetical protein